MYNLFPSKFWKWNWFAFGMPRIEHIQFRSLSFKLNQLYWIFLNLIHKRILSLLIKTQNDSRAHPTCFHVCLIIFFWIPTFSPHWFHYKDSDSNLKMDLNRDNPILISVHLFESSQGRWKVGKLNRLAIGLGLDLMVDSHRSLQMSSSTSDLVYFVFVSSLMCLSTLVSLIWSVHFFHAILSWVTSRMKIMHDWQFVW